MCEMPCADNEEEAEQPELERHRQGRSQGLAGGAMGSEKGALLRRSWGTATLKSGSPGEAARREGVRKTRPRRAPETGRSGWLNELNLD